MRAMITGSGGFIGRATVAHFLANGWEVVEFNIPDHDVQDAQDVFDTVDAYEVDAVVHLAGVLGTHELFDTPHLAIDVNIKGSMNVLEACRHLNAAYIGITMPQVFPSLYTATKVATTKMASAYAHTHGLKVAHVRAFNAYGAGQAHGPGHPQKIFPTFAYNATHGLPLPIWGNGQQGVDLIHTSDLARILFDATEHTVKNDVIRLNDLTFDGGSGQMLSVNQVAFLVNTLANGGDAPMLVEYRPMRRGEIPTDIVATGENWNVLGYGAPGQHDGLYVPAIRHHELVEAVEFYRNYEIH